MKTKILGGIAIVAIAVAVAFNVSVSNQKQDKVSLLALANVDALAQSEVDWNNPVSALGQWWNSSTANLTGLQFIGQEPYDKAVETGTYSVTTNPGSVTAHIDGDCNVSWSFTPTTQSTTKDYKTIKCCKDSYFSPYACTPDSEC